MTLALPKSVKARIHRVIRAGLRTRNLLIGSITVGFLVSVLESLCTGQVYLPTILFVTRLPDLRTRAIGFLLLYNVMFILPGYPVGGPFRNRLAAINSPGGGYSIDRKGKVVLMPDAEDVGDFSEGLAPAEKDGKFGYLDRSGEMVIPPTWDRVGAFRNGIAAVWKGGRRGYINRRGEYIWPLTK